MKVSKAVRVWLFIGVIMLFVQVILGGITRITGSGLSITKWDIITGSLPPLNLEQWKVAFELYKDTPQYHKINGGMSLEDFKFIFFWEFIHRLWARVMGFVFLFPFFYFILKKQLNTRLIKRLSIVFLLSAITASFGWIMVASGLMDRPWVNAYKLGFHLILAFITYAYLLKTYFIASYTPDEVVLRKKIYHLYQFYMVLLWIQIFLGGLVSGMKAGLMYNTWPSMSGYYIPPVLLEAKQWSLINFTLYDQNLFTPSLIQFVHRNIAYTIFILVFILVYNFRKPRHFNIIRNTSFSFIFIILLQVILGITILLTSAGEISVLYGVLHQAVAFFLLGISAYIFYKLRSNY